MESCCQGLESGNQVLTTEGHKETLGNDETLLYRACGNDMTICIYSCEKLSNRPAKIGEFYCI